MTHPQVPIVPGPPNQQPAPAPQPAAPPPPGPPRTKNSTILWICGALVGGLLLMFGFVSLLAGGVGSGGSRDDPAAADVGTPSCSHPSGTRDYLATVTVTNSTDQPRDYTVTVVFLRGDKTEITTGTGRINRLQPGKSFKVEVAGRAAPEFLGTCEVDSVRRS